MTRAEAVTFLWRAAGSPVPGTSRSPFADVTDTGAYYYRAVLWASDQGITGGVGNGQFGLSATLTYDQILAMPLPRLRRDGLRRRLVRCGSELGGGERTYGGPDVFPQGQLPPVRCGLLPVEAAGMTIMHCAIYAKSPCARHRGFYRHKTNSDPYHW